MIRQPGCPTDLALEAQLLRGGWDEHVSSCPHCQPRVAQMKELQVRFDSVVYPKLREHVTEAATRPVFGRWWPLRRLWPVALVPLATAALALAVFRPAPQADYVGIKGSADGALLEVYVGEGATGRLLGPGAVVRAGDGLRFVVLSPSERAFVFTVDATGRLSRLYPTAGDAPAPVSGLLPGGAILDEVVGPERVFAVFPRQGMSFGEVEQAVRATYRSAADVRSAERLPLDIPQRSVLLEKVAAP